MEANPQFSMQLFQQFLKIVTNLLQMEVGAESESLDLRLEKLNTVLFTLEGLVSASSQLIFQSIILYGEYIEKPTKPAC